MNLVLASGSAWKLDLLRRIGFDFVGVEHRADEDAHAGLEPRERVRRIAADKASSVETAGPAVVVGADQMLLLDGDLFGKAASADEARVRLARLAGRRHTLLGGWAVEIRSASGPGGGADTRALHASGIVESHLTMRPLDPAAIDRYVSTGEWEGSCGCYRYEAVGRQLFSAVDGDYFSILGMPVEALLPVLRELGAPGAL